MKRIIILFIVFCVFTNAFAQISATQTSNPNFSYPSSFIILNDSCYIIGETVLKSNNGSAYFTPKIRISKFDKNGKFIKSIYQTNDSLNVSLPERMLKDSTDNIYVLGYLQMSCDVFTDSMNVIFKYDKNLQLLWKTSVNSSTIKWRSPDRGGLAFDSKKNLVVVNCDKVSKLDPKTGKEILTYDAKGMSFNNIFILDGDNLLFSSDTFIYKTDSSCNLLWKKKVRNKYFKRLETNLFVSYFDSTITIYDSTLKNIGSYSSKSDKSGILDLSCDRKNVYATSYKYGEDNEYLLKFDLSLNLLGKTKLDRITNKGFVLSSGKNIAIAGDDASNKSGRTELLISDTSQIFSFSQKDVGIIGLRAGNIITKRLPTYGYMVIIETITIVVKNFGKDTVHSFTAYTTGSFSEWCTVTDANKNYSGLNLAPGDSVILPLGSFEDYTYPKPTTVYFHVCAYTCSPDREVDMNPHNDGICDTFVYTGIPESEASNITISLYPNPATSTIRLRSLSPLKEEFLILNSLGQILQKGKFNNSDSYELNVSSFPSGIYLMQFPQSGTTLKFAKE